MVLAFSKLSREIFEIKRNSFIYIKIVMKEFLNFSERVFKFLNRFPKNYYMFTRFFEKNFESVTIICIFNLILTTLNLTISEALDI